MYFSDSDMNKWMQQNDFSKDNELTKGLNSARKEAQDILTKDYSQNVKSWDDLLSKYAEYEYKKNDFNRLKETEITKRLAAELLGRMMIEENIVTPTQLNIIKNELDNPTYVEFKDMTGYNLYQHCTHALKTAHPTFAIKQLVRTHDFLTSNLLVQ